MPLKPDKAVQSAATADMRTRIVKAATACIRRYGLSKTAMEDVAKAAGVSRKTLYRTFSSRNALLNAVVQERANEYVEHLRDTVTSAPSFGDALVRSTAESLKWLRKDHALVSAIEGASERGVERYLVDPKSILHKITLNFWRDVFKVARERGELRHDLTDNEVVSCMRGTSLMLWLRDDFGPEQYEDFVRKLLLPSLAPAAEAKPRRKKKAV